MQLNGRLSVRAAAWSTAGLLCLSLAGCSDDGDEAVMSMDYPSYPSLTAMAQASQAVLEVRTSSSSTSRMLKAKESTGTEIGSSVPITVWPATVTTVLSGKATVGQSITVSEPGGKVDGTNYVVDGIKKLKGNTTYLVYVEFVEPGRAEVLGGDEGQFEKTGTNFVSPKFGAITLAKAKASITPARSTSSS